MSLSQALNQFAQNLGRYLRIMPSAALWQTVWMLLHQIPFRTMR